MQTVNWPALLVFVGLFGFVTWLAWDACCLAPLNCSHGRCHSVPVRPLAEARGKSA